MDFFGFVMSVCSIDDTGDGRREEMFQNVSFAAIKQRWVSVGSMKKGKRTWQSLERSSKSDIRDAFFRNLQGPTKAP